MNAATRADLTAVLDRVAVVLGDIRLTEPGAPAILTTISAELGDAATVLARGDASDQDIAARLRRINALLSEAAGE